MEKEIRWSEHAKLKLEILNQRSIKVSADLVTEIVRTPNALIDENDKKIAQSRITNEIVLRVVYRKFSAFILIITLYPGRRTRYEKDSLQ
jgi:hypothetical protein